MTPSPSLRPAPLTLAIALLAAAIAACSSSSTPTDATSPTSPTETTPPGETGQPGDGDAGEGTTSPTGTCDPACPANEICDGGKCVPLPASCPCPKGSYCDLATNACVVGCIAEGECPAGQFCDVDARKCEAGCATDLHCPAGNYCDVPTKTCRKGCRANDECPSGEACVDHACGCPAGTLRCGGVCAACPAGGGGSCCGNACVARDRDPLNCGTCGNDCSVWANAKGVSPNATFCAASQCTTSRSSPGGQPRQTCNEVCAAGGLTCVNPPLEPTGYLQGWCKNACVGKQQYMFTNVNAVCQETYEHTSCGALAPTTINCVYDGMLREGAPYRTTCICR